MIKFIAIAAERREQCATKAKFASVISVQCAQIDNRNTQILQQFHNIYAWKTVMLHVQHKL